MFTDHFQRNQRGQAGIVVLLLMVVLVTIALSIASRTVSDIRLSRQEEETTRAFDAAEAGIEEALRTGASGTITVGDMTADFQVEQLNLVETVLDEGETLDINVNGFLGAAVNIFWGDPAESCTVDPVFASLVVTHITASNGVLRNPYSGIGCDRGDGFSAAQASTNPDYRWTRTEAVNAGDLQLRIRSLYAGTKILVRSADASPLPAQYVLIHSEAAGSGGETRAVEVTRTRPFPPSIFDFAIFSKGSLIKN